MLSQMALLTILSCPTREVQVTLKMDVNEIWLMYINNAFVILNPLYLNVHMKHAASEWNHLLTTTNPPWPREAIGSSWRQSCIHVKSYSVVVMDGRNKEGTRGWILYLPTEGLPPSGRGAYQGDWAVGGKSLQGKAVKEDLLAAVQTKRVQARDDSRHDIAYVCSNRPHGCG